MERIRLRISDEAALRASSLSDIALSALPSSFSTPLSTSTKKSKRTTTK